MFRKTRKHRHQDDPPESSGVDLPDNLRLPRQEIAGRMMPHPAAITIDSDVRRCAACGAERDWLVLNVGPHVFLRCRCTHEWHEPTLNAAWYDRVSGPTVSVFASLHDGVRSHAYDGSLTGSYL